MQKELVRRVKNFTSVNNTLLYLLFSRQNITMVLIYVCTLKFVFYRLPSSYRPKKCKTISQACCMQLHRVIIAAHSTWSKCAKCNLNSISQIVKIYCFRSIKTGLKIRKQGRWLSLSSKTLEISTQNPKNAKVAILNRFLLVFPLERGFNRQNEAEGPTHSPYTNDF